MTAAPTAPPIPPTVVAPPGTPAPGAPEVKPPVDETLYAGKLKGPAALEKADREITKELGLPPLPDGELIGAGKLYTDIAAQEAAYKRKEALYAKWKAPEAPPPAPEIKPGTPLEVKPTATPAPSEAEKDLDWREVLEKAGLTAEEIYEQWNKPADQGGGKLTDTQYAKIKAVNGWGKKTTDSVAALAITAYQANQVLIRTTAIEAAGGEQQLATLIDSANRRYKGKEKEAADITRQLRDPALVAGVVRRLKWEHAESLGASASRDIATGGPAPATRTDVITDPKEYEALAEKGPHARTADENKRFNATNPNIMLRR